MPTVLPRSWLKCEWVVSFCTCPEDGSITGAAVQEPDLFLWIRQTQYPELTAKQYRNSLRALCMDQRPGYKASPLPSELRTILNAAMGEVGKKRWAAQCCSLSAPVRECYLARLNAFESAIETEGGLASSALPVVDGGIESGTIAAIDSSTLQTACNVQTDNDAVMMQGASASDVASSAAPSPFHPHGAGTGSDLISMAIAQVTERQTTAATTALGVRSQADMLTASNWDDRACGSRQLNPYSAEPIPKRAANEDRPPRMAAAQFNASTVSAELPPLVDRCSGLGGANTIGDELDSFRLFQARLTAEGSEDDDDDDNDDDGGGVDSNWQGYEGIDVDSPASFFETGDHLELEAAQKDEFVKEFDDAMAKFQDFGLMSKVDYYDMEQHYTSCFSDPSQVGFWVYHTDRHHIWRPSPYVNERATQIMGFDPCVKMHTVLSTATILRVKKLMEPAQPEEVIYVPDIHLNCLDQLGNSIVKICDGWVPLITLNSNEALFLMAVKGSTTLLRHPGVFR
jgi:hypothetical protein